MHVAINLMKFYLPQVGTLFLNCGFTFSTIHSTELTRRPALERDGGKFQPQNLKLVESKVRKIAVTTSKKYQQNTRVSDQFQVYFEQFR